MKRLSMDGLPRDNRSTVLLGFWPGERQMDLLFELANAWGWDLLSLDQLEGQIPADLNLAGALIRDLPDGELAKELRERGCPAVRLGNFPHSQDSKLPAVLPDVAAAGRLAAEHFVERRFKELAIVTHHGSAPGRPFHALWTAFTERTRELGVRCHFHDYMKAGEEKLTKEERFAQRARHLAVWLAEIPKPVGVFTLGDDIADMICRMCTREKIRVPDDVAILGRGDKRECRLSLIQLSSIDMADLDRTRQAMRLLKRLMAGEPAPSSPIMVPPSRIVERQSTDVLAVTDPVVARALNFIWEDIQKSPTVGEVADALGIARRTLERRFRIAVGCGVKAEILRRRLQVYCRLLRSSDEPIVNLAAMAGYRSLETMHLQFRKAMGTSPGAYRRERRGRGAGGREIR